MTTPITDSSAPAAPTATSASSVAQPKAESFLDWFHVNSRLVTIGAITVLAVAFGVWFKQRMSINETLGADRKLLAAKQSMNTGNIPLAESDLKKIVDQYASKPSGVEAGLLLGQLRMEKGDYAAAVGGLRELVGKLGSSAGSAEARSLLGDALAQSDKAADAAAEYERAASATSMVNARAFLTAKAARAYMTAGKPAEARKLWETLAAQSDNEGLATEARVRLGELAAGSKS